jgi:hypothetical protein
VAVGSHAFDGRGVAGCGVDLAFVDVVAGDEEGAFRVVLFEEVEDVVSVVVEGAIVVG